MNVVLNRNSVSTFIQSGYTCPVCKDAVLTFGDVPPPTVCPNCQSNGPFAIVWKHAVSTKTTVIDLLAQGKPA